MPRARTLGVEDRPVGDWQQGDYLLLTVNKTLAALAFASGEPFKSDKKVWDNGLYPFRIPINFQIIVEPAARPLILGDIRDVLTSVWGPTYGWGILNQNVLVGDAAEKLIAAIKAAPNRLDYFRVHLSEKLDEAAAQRKTSLKVTGNRRKSGLTVPDQPKVLAQPLIPFDEKATPKEESAHHKTQYTLKRLGKVTGCSVWIASNDRSKQYKGKALSDGALQKLPSLGLDADVVSRMSMIDVIWLQQNAPVCAFEVETTTSIYSGLLRMSDLLAVVPALKINLFIVAPKDRRNKFLAELGRPTFRKIGLSDYCRFIAIEDLEGLVAKVGDLQGIQPTILNNIALEIQDGIEV